MRRSSSGFVHIFLIIIIGLLLAGGYIYKTKIRTHLVDFYVKDAQTTWKDIPGDVFSYSVPPLWQISSGKSEAKDLTGHLIFSIVEKNDNWKSFAGEISEDKDLSPCAANLNMDSVDTTIAGLNTYFFVNSLCAKGGKTISAVTISAGKCIDKETHSNFGPQAKNCIDLHKDNPKYSQYDFNLVCQNSILFSFNQDDCVQLYNQLISRIKFTEDKLILTSEHVTNENGYSQYRNSDLGISFGYPTADIALSEKENLGVFDIHLQYCKGKDKYIKNGAEICETQDNINDIHVRYYKNGNAPTSSQGENNSCLLKTPAFYNQGKAVFGSVTFRSFFYEASESDLATCGLGKVLLDGNYTYYFPTTTKFLPLVIQVGNPTVEAFQVLKGVLNTLNFSGGKLTKEEAIAKVRQIPEIVDWIKATKTEPYFVVNESSDKYNVSVGQKGGNYPFNYVVSKLTGDIQY